MSDENSQIEGGGRKVDPGFSRNMKIIGIFLIVVLGAFALLLFSVLGGGSKSSKSERVAISPGIQQGQVKSDGEQTPSMQRMLEERQAAEAAQAQKEGRSYVPTEAIGSVEPVVPAAPPPASTMQVSMENVNYQGNADQAQAIREGLRNQLMAIIPASVNQGAPRQSLSFNRDRQSTQSGSQASGQPGTGPGVAQPAARLPEPSRAIIPPLEIMTAKLANPITAIMGKPSYASALITSGEFKGAFLTGTSTLNENETIETNFTLMRFGDKGYKIDAIVLDEQTADAGVKGDIDRRILQRYVLPIAVAAAQGYYTAASQTGSTVLAVGVGTGATSAPPPTSEQARNAGIAAGLGIASKDIQKNAEQPIRASVSRDMTIGILFRAAVKDEIK